MRLLFGACWGASDIWSDKNMPDRNSSHTTPAVSIQSGILARRIQVSRWAVTVEGNPFALLPRPTLLLLVPSYSPLFSLDLSPPPLSSSSCPSCPCLRCPACCLCSCSILAAPPACFKVSQWSCAPFLNCPHPTPDFLSPSWFSDYPFRSSMYPFLISFFAMLIYPFSQLPLPAHSESVCCNPLCGDSEKK